MKILCDSCRVISLYSCRATKLKNFRPKGESNPNISSHWKDFTITKPEPSRNRT